MKPGAVHSSDEATLHYFPERLFVSGADANPVVARSNNQALYNNAFGLSERWQVGGFTQTYWWRAVEQTDPTSAPSQLYLMPVYETLMQLFSAIQLSGPPLTPTNVEHGLYTWRRAFSVTSNPSLSPSSPAAGFTSADHSFIKGMVEELWDATGIPPGGPSQTSPFWSGSTGNGCYRIIDHVERRSAVTWPGTTPWPNADHSNESAQSAPCAGDYD